MQSPVEEQVLVVRKLVIRWGIFTLVLIFGVTFLWRPGASLKLFGRGSHGQKSIVLLSGQEENPSLRLRDAIQRLKKQEPTVLEIEANAGAVDVPAKLVMEISEKRGKFPSMLLLETDGRFRDEVFDMFDISYPERKRLNDGMKGILEASVERAVDRVEPRMVDGKIDALLVPEIKSDTTKALSELLNETSLPRNSQELMLKIFQTSNLRGWERPGILSPIRDDDGNVTAYEYRIEAVKGKWIVDREFSAKSLAEEANNLSYKYLIAILEKYW